MKKNIYLFLLALLSQTSFAQFEGYENATSNKELIEFLESDKGKFERLINIFTETKEPTEPREAKPLKFEFNQAEFDRQVDEKSHYNFKFINDIKNDKIVVYLFKDENVYSSLDDLGAQIYPTKIYYHDGTTEIPVEKKSISRSFPNDLELKKAVNKFDTEFVFSTPKQLDSIVIPVKNKLKSKSKGYDFEIIKQDDQSVTFKTNYPDTDFIEVQAISENNKRIKKKSYTILSITQESFKEASNKLIKQIDKVLAIAKKDTLMDFEKFKVKFFSNLESLKNETENIFNKDSNESYITYTFGTPVKQLIMYYNEGVYERKINNTITLKKNQTYLSDSKDDVDNFYDLNGKLITEIVGNYYYENERFYTDLNRYYYFDLSKKQMIPLSYYKIEIVSNNFILAKEDDESPFELIDGNNKKIMTVDGYNYDKDFDVTLIHSNNKYYILNNQNQEPIEIKNIDKLSYAEKGFFVANKNNKFGFVDSNGKIIIPIEYDEVQPFDDFVDLTYQDLLFGVKKNEEWGFVDSKNKTVIPFMYSEVKGPFSYGIAPVYDGDKLGLINVKNTKITKFTGQNHSSSSNFGKRAMSLPDGYYNYLGELEKR